MAPSVEPPWLGCEQVLTAPIDVRARAHDASHFLLYPRAVAVPRDAVEVARLLRACAEADLSVTFRSGGTSLSGQAGTDAVLADVRRHFAAVEVLDGGARVRVQPGVTIDRVNAHLRPYGRQLGPDPASSAACTVGGVVANNSSGMACGTTDNAYRTVESLLVVLADGTVLDTGAADADDRLRATNEPLWSGLAGLRDRIRANPASVATITQQFSMKNTMGYGLNSFLDFHAPVDVLARLMIGSEGTLGFVASATFRTIPIRSQVRTGLLVFEDLYAANRALPELVASGAATLELMDIASVRVGQSLPNCPPRIAAIHPERQAVLLVEYQSADAEELRHIVADAEPVLASLPVAQPVALTGDPTVREQLWVLRKGLYASVAAARRPGTTALLEDVVVPVDTLADTCADLAGLFDEFGYPDSVIFGHAKDGNIHFMITDEFERRLDRYERFTDAMVDVVLGRRGSLKAEHGTGRVMAPFVRRQYGDELYAVMREIKNLFDPRGTLNAGVVLTDDPKAHLRHVKAPTAVDPMLDACVECGYCEPVCPARELTLTPRQRIAAQREIARARADGAPDLARALEQAYRYAGIQTCAVDGMCSTACPVGINTGLYIKKRRAESAPRAAQAGWGLAAKHWAGSTRAASLALTAAHGLRPIAPVITAANRAGRALLGADQVPLWSPELPGGGRRRKRRRDMRGAAGPVPAGKAPAGKVPAGKAPAGKAPAGKAAAERGAGGHPCAVEASPVAPVAVYLPACVNSMFGPAPVPAPATGREGQPSSGHGGKGRPAGVQGAFEALCASAGLALMVPEGVDSLCCGTPWTSKGLARGRDAMAAKVIPALRAASDNGRLPIVCDASSCTEGFARTVADCPELRVIDCVQFTAERVLPKLGAVNKLASITIHPSCSSTQIGLNPFLVAVAHAVAERVNVPTDAGCCAFAGDRGMLHPELTRAATRAEAAEVAALSGAAHAGCNRTCELGMTRATGQPYRHILEILADQLATA
ncbi:MAG: FAD-binding oxidoreductase [Actinomycetia bacterium]|nr:FAD-binding oxidoreductase [Actinomycetes bacterium]